MATGLGGGGMNGLKYDEHGGWEFGGGEFLIHGHAIVQLTFWRRNYFFLILAHPVYKM